MNIVLNGGKILKDITDALASWKAANYYNFGFDIGDFIFRVLLINNYKGFGPNDTFELVKGLL